MRRPARPCPGLLEKHELVVPTIVQVEVLHHVRMALADVFGPIHDRLHLDRLRPGLDAPTVDDVIHLLRERAADGRGGRDAAILIQARRHGATLLSNDGALLRAAKAVAVATRPWSSLR